MKIGANCVSDGVRFCVWAPGHTVGVVVNGATYPLEPDEEGYHSCTVPSVGPGTLYSYFIDGEGPYPDPSSRYQPDGPLGPSEVIDPTFAWDDHNWPGTPANQVYYELHVGTFTKEGTYQAAITRLVHLQELGITTIELMPVNEFSGDFGWGYDGVGWFAPYRKYGRPDDLRKFVNAAHRHGLAVILDVVYNHFGPVGNFLPKFSEHYLNKESTEWGAGPNFDAERSGPVREWVCANAVYWIQEFHMDGFRLDATQSIFDKSDTHIIEELTAKARDAAQGRTITVVAENEPQHSKLMRPIEDDGYGLDGMWNDDFHHSAIVCLTGRKEAYYQDYTGTAHELVAAAKRGFLFQGQFYDWQKKRRGTPTGGIAPKNFICFLENHDQVANTGSGQRLSSITLPAQYRAMTTLLLLGPWSPLLFQGQELGSEKIFPYFAHHEDHQLAALVRKGRQESVAQFPTYASKESREKMPDPCARKTFEKAKLSWIDPHAGVPQSVRLHQDLLELRKRLLDCYAFDAVALSDTCLVFRWFGNDHLLVVNLGQDVKLRLSEPLLAPPESTRFRWLWASEEMRYGGQGCPDGMTDDTGFQIPAHTAILYESITD